jgi:hypothetical protein
MRTIKALKILPKAKKPEYSELMNCVLKDLNPDWSTRGGRPGMSDEQVLRAYILHAVMFSAFEKS